MNCLTRKLFSTNLHFFGNHLLNNVSTKHGKMFAFSQNRKLFLHQSVKKFNFNIESAQIYLLVSIDVCAHKTCSVPNIDSEGTRNQRKYTTGDESKIGEDIHVLKLQFIESLTKIQRSKGIDKMVKIGRKEPVFIYTVLARHSKILF